MYDGEHAVDENRHPIWGAETTYASSSSLRVNHYYTKSIEEFERKQARARAWTGNLREEALDRILEQERRLSAPDDAIAQFLPPLRQVLASRVSDKPDSVDLGAEPELQS